MEIILLMFQALAVTVGIENLVKISIVGKMCSCILCLDARWKEEKNPTAINEQLNLYNAAVSISLENSTSLSRMCAPSL